MMTDQASNFIVGYHLVTGFLGFTHESLQVSYVSGSIFQPDRAGLICDIVAHVNGSACNPLAAPLK